MSEGAIPLSKMEEKAYTLGFAQMVGEMREHLLTGKYDDARELLNGFINTFHRDVVSTRRRFVEGNMSVAELLDSDIAKLLQESGYETALSVRMATDAELLAIPTVRSGTLKLIREVLPCKARRRVSSEVAPLYSREQVVFESAQDRKQRLEKIDRHYRRSEESVAADEKALVKKGWRP